VRFAHGNVASLVMWVWPPERGLEQVGDGRSAPEREERQEFAAPLPCTQFMRRTTQWPDLRRADYGVLTVLGKASGAACSRGRARRW